jgi:hypothetical protein
MAAPSHPTERGLHRAAWSASLLAFAVGAPGLFLPFLSDDWSNLVAVAGGIPPLTPFGYFRPLYLATLRADLLLWGLHPAGFHLTNLLLIAGSAALVVLLAHRYSGSVELAALAGVLFALHPYHVESAAWIAARADPLSALLVLGAALSYDRWREEHRGLPLGACVLFLSAMLAKENAVLLPVFLLFVGFAIPGRRPSRPEWLKGHLTLAVLAIAYVGWMRHVAWDAVWGRVLHSVGISWLARLLYFGTAALVPAHPEILEASPALWGAVAAIAGIALLICARRGSTRVPEGVWIGVAAFVILLGFTVFSLQERFFYLASAAAASAVACALHAARPRARRALLALLACGWLASTAWHWNAWLEAGSVSTRVVADLVRSSLQPEVSEIVVANMPHRVHGIAIAGNYAAAVLVSGRRSLSVYPALYVDYPDSRSETLAGSIACAVRPGSSSVEIALDVPRRMFSRFVDPRAGTQPNPTLTEIVDADPEHPVVRIPLRSGRVNAVWNDGAIVPLP